MMGASSLLRLSWLASVHADEYLDKHAGSGAAVMRRHQDLPNEAFFEPAAAAAMLDRSDRSILVLSYRWGLIAHPDPLGVTLAAVRRFAASAKVHLDSMRPVLGLRVCTSAWHQR